MRLGTGCPIRMSCSSSSRYGRHASDAIQSGESDVLYRVGPRNYNVLQKDAARRGLALQNLGPGMEFAFLFFNLADLPRTAPPEIVAHQAWFRRLPFRQAVSAAVDRDALVRLACTASPRHPLAGLAPPGNKDWTP